MIDHYGKCPVCEFDFDGGDIVETFKKMRDQGNSYWKDKTDQDIEIEVKGRGKEGDKDFVRGSYGPPYHWSNIMGIEIQGQYDGVSYYMCVKCKTYWDRFTGQQMTEEEFKQKVR